MLKLVAKCGIDCGTCPWGPYPRKGMTSEEIERYRNNAKRILGYIPIKTPCLTCQTPDSKIRKETKLPNRNCLIRQCVDKIGVANCAYCSRFPCDTVKATGGVWNRKSIEEKLGTPISEKEYHVFIEPFEGISRLETIRASLKPEEIVEPAKAPISETGITDFPENLSFSKEETASFKEVHRLLATIKRSSLGLHNTDTFAQQHNLKNRRAHVLRFLWILGRYSTLKKEKSTYLVVDAETYEANRGSEKTLAIWSFVRDTVFKVLAEFGVCCERVILKGVKEEDLVTGTGYLRSKGWLMKMSFEEKIGGTPALEALQTYTRRLDGKYGKKAFQHFLEVDLQFLLEK
ncbi:DUF3795 domain-containing protein [Candidatus Bathyarchaeota archaeon]|nr:DUF3795 domain-containing protein [Candidatus Bathyarchaeota archaeon]